VECGQHWDRSAAHVALQTTLRFIAHFDMIDPRFARKHIDPAPLLQQHVIEVTEGITIRSSRFRFTVPVQGLGIIPDAGTLLALDGDNEIRTPYADCVLVMPHLQSSKKIGETAVRLGRYI
jgi:hypothetical protein